jgi:hypothetical protein
MTSTTTSLPSSSSDLTQALLALRDLVDSTPASTEPSCVSAIQQARLVLRRHEVASDGDSRRRTDDHPAR